MAASDAVWGIEIGQCALKALKLRATGEDTVEAVAFDVIEHERILSQPDAEPDDLIRDAIKTFAERNEWQRDRIVLGVPGQQTFSRFTKLPPVDKKDQKQLAKLIQFEAEQQIPFEINEVVWDYEVFSDDDSPQTELGIFAMRTDLLRKHIDQFSEFGLAPNLIQAAPSALYNFAHFEFAPKTSDQATVLIDVGAQSTDLIVIEQNGGWIRNIHLGGNKFTETLMKTFKLKFPKAESLKRTAASSKYARQIFQAMRPVFAELVAEIQRSFGHYSASHRDIELTRVVAMGNAFQLPGLQKYLENNLNFDDPVQKPSKFDRLSYADTLDASQLSENILGFGAAYGLALQGLDLARIRSNLLPVELARVAAWRKKTPYWIGAAAALGVAAAAPWTRIMLDSGALADSPIVSEAQRVQNEAERFKRDFNTAKPDPAPKSAQVDAAVGLLERQAIVPRLFSLLNEALPPLDPAVAEAENPAEFAALLARNPGLARTQRQQFFLDDVTLYYSPNIEEFNPPRDGRSRNDRGNRNNFGAAATAGKPGFYVGVSGRLTFGETRANASPLISEVVYGALQTLGRRPGLGFHVLIDEERGRPRFFRPPELTQFEPAGARRDNDDDDPLGRDDRRSNNREDDQQEVLDPVTGEPVDTDWAFSFGFYVALGDAPPEAPGN